MQHIMKVPTSIASILIKRQAANSNAICPVNRNI